MLSRHFALLVCSTLVAGCNLSLTGAPCRVDEQCPSDQYCAATQKCAKGARLDGGSGTGGGEAAGGGSATGGGSGGGAANGGGAGTSGGGGGTAICTADSQCGAHAYCDGTTCVADTTAPTVTISTPKAGPILPGALTLSGTANDGAGGGVLAVVYSVDGAPDVTATFSSGTFTAALTLPAVDKQVHLVVKATDRAGNQASTAVDVTVDTLAPQVVIATPSTDANCPGVSPCTGAVVNLGSGSTFSFAGTFADASGAPPPNGLIATLEDSVGQLATWTLTVDGTGGWSVAWTNLPSDDGKLFTFAVVGTDAVGHTTKVARRLWLDRTAPTAVAQVPWYRLISRTTRLLSFSEVMDVASVVSATTLNGGTPASSYGSTDGKGFGFTRTTDLLAYQVYALTVGLGAKDRAGNSLSTQFSEHFLTEMEPVPTQIQFGNSGLPKVAVDADGKPFLAYTNDKTGELRLAYWDGRAVKDSAVSLMTKFPPATTDVLVSGVPDKDLVLRPTVELLLDTGGAGVTYLRTTDLSQWTGLASDTPDVIPTDGYDLSARRPSFSLEVDTSKALVQADIIYSIGTGLNLARPVAGTWVLEKLLPSVNASLEEATAWKAETLYGLEPSGGTIIAVDGYRSFVQASGQQQLWRADLKGPVGSAYAFGVLEDSIGSFSALLLCSPSPTKPGSWTQLSLTLPAKDTVRRVATELSPTTFAVAIAQDSGVAFLTSPNDGCAAAPTPPSKWSAQIPSARSPALAIGPAGEIWRAYVLDNVNGTSSVVLEH